jgi:predicted P-loop ATPase
LSVVAPSTNSGVVTSAVQPVDCLNNVGRLPVTAFPHQRGSGGGGPPCTIQNVRHLLDAYRITVRYNVIKKKLEVRVPGLTSSVDNADNVAITHIESLAVLNGLNSGRVPSYVETIADSNLYNPVAEWIMSRPWDGVDRLQAFYATLIEGPDFPKALKDAILFRWSLSLVASALKPQGFHGRGVLTLQGGQGLGKTSWVRALVSDAALGASVIKVDHHLDPSNKDSIITAACHWIVELGELDSTFRKDIARLKGFLTSDIDKVRRPYARVDSTYPRRVVFCATVNAHTFLVDPTGNTRWWTIPVVGINFKHGIDMQQVYAQLAESFNQGEQWWLTPEEEAQLESCNSAHSVQSAISEMVTDAIDHDRKPDTSDPYVTASKLLMAIGIQRPTNPQCKEAATALRNLYGAPKRVRGSMQWRVCLRTQTLTSFDEEAKSFSAQEIDDSMY